MASPKSEQGADARPAVDPIGALESAAGRLGVWVQRVGETRLAYTILATAFFVAAILILVWGRDQTFVNDEWTYLIADRDWSLDTLFGPQNGHLIVAPLLIYKGLFATVGADSHLPFQVVTVILHLTVALLFFLLVRTRLTLAVAVALTVLVAFFGAGWDTVMGAYELPNLTGMAAGLGMLLAVQRRTPTGDVAACLLLMLALASFSVGIAFAVGAFLAIWLAGRADWSRLWIVVVPAALYAAWFIWARKHGGQPEVTAEAVSSLFSGMADQVAAICAAITGLFRASGSAELTDLIQIRPEWGYTLALLLAALVVLHLRRSPRSIYFWAVTGVLLAYLALVAVGLSPARAPNASRYVYLGGILTLLLVAELGADIRWSTKIGLVASVLFALSLMANVAELRVGGHLFAAEGETNRATLAALELSRTKVDPDFAVEDESVTHSHPDMFFSAGEYFDAVESFGSPAFSVDELRNAGTQAREAADQAQVRVFSLAPKPLAAGVLGRRGPRPKLLMVSGGKAISAADGCLVLSPNRGRTATIQLAIPPGGFAYRTPRGAEVSLRVARFGDAFSTALPSLAGSAELLIPSDASDVPWRAEMTTGAQTLVC